MTLAGVSSKAGLALADKTFGGVNATTSTSTRDLETVCILRERTSTHTVLTYLIN